METKHARQANSLEPLESKELDKQGPGALKHLCHDPVFHRRRFGLLLGAVMLGQGLKEVQITLEVDVLASMEWGLAEYFEADTDASRKGDLLQTELAGSLPPTATGKTTYDAIVEYEGGHCKME
jgi:hypothetical protein